MEELYKIESFDHPTQGTLYKEIKYIMDGDKVVNKEFSRNLSFMSIPLLKIWQKDRIDAKTREIIDRGFTYAGLDWSLSLTAQINWSNLPHIPETIGGISNWPMALQALDGTMYYLPYANRMQFYMIAVGNKNSALQSGHILKVQVDNMDSKEDIILFNDERE